MGKCVCCDKDAIIYCAARDAWTCKDCYLPSGMVVSEVDYLLAVQRAVVAEEALKDIKARAK